MSRQSSGRGNVGRASPSAINGFLVLDKPVGVTSMDVVRRVKLLTGMRKRVGHGGTLDPLASGILPICFGQATRLMEHLINETKGYRMEVRLGISTNTYDAEGEVVEENDPSLVTREQVEEALGSFRGTIQQKPPMHSALKKGGKRLYELARQGVTMELEPRQVEVYSLDLLNFKPPFVTIESQCGRGVYMRSLAHDLGQFLGCGAHTSSLVRLRTGSFNIDDAVTLDEFIQAVEEGRWRELIRPLDSLLLNMKGAVVGESAERFLRNGHPVSLGYHGLYAGHLENYRIYSTDGRFLGVVRFDRSNNRWEPYKVFKLEEPSPHAPSQQ